MGAEEKESGGCRKNDMNYFSTNEKVAAEVAIPAVDASPVLASSVAGSVPSFQ